VHCVIPFFREAAKQWPACVVFPFHAVFVNSLDGWSDRNIEPFWVQID